MNRNNESRDDASYPGADVVEIVNLRGDKTTIYKLADGTYMDRIDRHFTYNGTDTWTDENGAEWNEVAKGFLSDAFVICFQFHFRIPPVPHNSNK